MPLLGGGFDARGLLRAAVYGAIGVIAVVGRQRLRALEHDHATGSATTRDPPSHRARCARTTPTSRWTGSRRSTSTRARCSGCSACSRVDVQTGAGKKGGEISLPALTPGGRRGAARGAAAGGGAAPVDASRRAGAARSSRPRARDRRASPPASSASLLPVARRRRPGRLSRSSTSERGEDAVRLAPALGDRRSCSVVVGLLVARLAALDPSARVVAFGGFTIDPRRRAPADPARARRAQRGDGAGRPRARRARGRGHAAAPVRARAR